MTFYRLSNGKSSYGTGWSTHDSHEGPETQGGCYCCSLRPYCSILPPPHSTHTTQDRASFSIAGMANMWYTCYCSLHHSFQPMVDTANSSWWPFLKSSNVFGNKVLLGRSHVRQLCIAYSCSLSFFKTAVLSSCNRVLTAYKAEHVYYLALYKKGLPTFAHF